jgi:hypothetical protein
LKEVSRQCSTGAVEEVESVEKADTRQPKGANNRWQQKANRLRNVQREMNRRYCIFGNCIASVRSQVRSAAPLSSLAKECPMEFKEYDFTRNPVVQSEVFLLESKCTACGFSILVRSVEELVEHEKLHRTQCSPSNAAA